MKRFAKYKLIPLKTPLYERLQVLLTYLFQKGGMGGFAIPPPQHSQLQKQIIIELLFIFLSCQKSLPTLPRVVG